MRLIASPVCAIDSIRSLRCVVRNMWRVSSSSNCSIAIMLTGPSRSIFPRSAAIASSALSVALLGGDHRGVRRRQLVGRAGDRRTPSSSDSRSSASTTAASGVVWPVALELLDFDDDLVERRVDRVLAGVREVREIGFGGRARDVELRDHGADRVERGRARSLIAASSSSARDAQRRDRFTGGHAPSRAGRRARGTSASSCAWPAAMRRQLVDAPPACRRAPRRAPRRALELGARFFEPQLGRQRAGALDQRGMRGAGLRGPPA